jgi:transcriptional regulator with XRE-family HTH domain
MITRIRELLEARQLSPTQFADLIGVGRPVISHILSERNKPSLEVVQKIIGAFPELSMPWLLAGTGPMLAAAVASPAILPPIDTTAPPAPLTAAPPTAAIPTPPPAASIIRPAVATYPVAASSPSTYPQPPRFRRDVAASASPASLEIAASAVAEPALVANTVPATAASPSPAAFSAPVATPIATATTAVAAAPESLPLPSTSPLPPITSDHFQQASSNSPASAAEASALPNSAEIPAPSSNPAAALSFLGEPGKAIRRIVIFYRDGSFSDYLPEGN